MPVSSKKKTAGRKAGTGKSKTADRKTSRITKSNGKKNQKTQDSHVLFIPEVFNCPAGQIAKEQSEKYILFFVLPLIGMHKIPWNLGNECKQKKIPPIFQTVPRVKKSLTQQKTENRKRDSSDIPAYPV